MEHTVGSTQMSQPSLNWADKGTGSAKNFPDLSAQLVKKLHYPL